MPSNAFMEVSTYDISGESGDVSYGQDTDYAMFEIASLEFETGATSSDDKNKGKKDAGNKKQQQQQHPTPNSSSSTANDQDTRKGKITVTKSIDYASPDLFRYCCEKK